MAKNKSTQQKNSAKHKQQAHRSAQPAASHEPSPQSQSASPLVFAFGAIALLVSIISAAVLALDHLNIVQPPGCGVGSGCDLATRGPWGSIPGIGWPLSLLGLAYFAALLTEWIRSRGKVSAGLAALLWTGGAGSVLLISVMVVNGYVCKYCIATHLGNLAFIGTAYVAYNRHALAPFPKQAAVIGSAFAIATVLLAVVNWQAAELRTARGEADLSASTQEIIKRTAEAGSQSTGESVARVDVDDADTAAAEPEVKLFTGRYRIGPIDASIRIVMFSDFQCADCRRIEGDMRQILAQRDDVSFSNKHLPLCTDCNRLVPKDRNLHPNACWAARAAEAAGILRGDEGYWEMNHWLFDRKGSFTDSELQAGLRSMGYDVQEFLSVMTSDRTLELVQADIEQAIELGLQYTPTIFINGVELRGYRQVNALERAINAVAATNPPRALPTNDHPPLAPQKYVDDWKIQMARPMPADDACWKRGPDDAPVKIILWSDYQLQGTATLNSALQQLFAARNDVQYIYRHFPFDKACNPIVSQTRSPEGCLAASAAEAAGTLGGPEKFWAMHEWLLQNQQNITNDSLRSAAAEIGLDPDRFLASLNDAAVRNRVERDVTAGRSLNITGIPALYINGRRVPRWELEGHDILLRIVEEAAAMGR